MNERVVGADTFISAKGMTAKDLEELPRVDSFDGQRDDLEHLTDLGNAGRFVRLHAAAVRYCPHLGSWFIWTGQRWDKDETGEVVRLAKETVRRIYAEAAVLSDDHLRRAVAAHAVKSENEARIKAMIELAKTEPGIPVTPDQLDTDRWVLNVLNGTLDLRAGELRPHRREDLITKLVPIPFNPEATCPTWEGALERWMNGNPTMVKFIQRGVGYSLTGEANEQVIIIPYGTGSNGKTTFLLTITSMLGDYARWTPTDTLLIKRGDPIRNDVARLHRARLVAAVEAEEGKRFAEALVKSLTGGDVVSARFLHREFFEFQPTFKVWLAVNHKPVIRGTDHAIWRRIRLVPFTVTIPDDEQDKGLVNKLKAELPGILRWAVEGCLAWQREGLGMPEEVRTATAAYREEMDLLAAFLAERCIVAARESVALKDLYDDFCTWCKASGESATTKRAFGTLLTERGFPPDRINRERIRRGLRLRLATDDDLFHDDDEPAWVRGDA